MVKIIGFEKIKSIIADPVKKQKFLTIILILAFFAISVILYLGYFKSAEKIEFRLISFADKEIGKVSLNLDILRNEKYQNLQLYFTPVKLGEERNANPFAQLK